MNREIRLKLCSPPIIDQQGNINHAYFADIPGAHWSENDEDLLIQGIERYGVGNYDQISKHLLPNKDIIEIRLRTCMLLGAHNIDEFKGLKDSNKIADIKTKNLNAGKKTGKLKYGIYLNYNLN
ncbi:hypothetical protein SteCoe_24843 [Stentor coeruleus]|uniref:Myb-like domain-containing protein n=1 Tax=Stentor coeruleus TaxID=5963 RepID=A0A1R2BGK2_9CILI|nr:hypothetical protein SteCoe_24843 [Stentor coeruleus]